MSNKYKTFKTLSDLNAVEIKKIIVKNLEDNHLLSTILKEYEIFTPITVRIEEHSLYGILYGILLVPKEIANMKIYRCHDFIGYARVRESYDE